MYLPPVFRISEGRSSDSLAEAESFIWSSSSMLDPLPKGLSRWIELISWKRILDPQIVVLLVAFWNGRKPLFSKRDSFFFLCLKARFLRRPTAKAIRLFVVDCIHLAISVRGGWQLQINWKQKSHCFLYIVLGKF